MPGCQIVFNRPTEEVFGVLAEAAERVGEAEVLAGDIAVSVMGPSVGLVAEVLAQAVEMLLSDGEPLSAALTLSEG